MHVDTMFPSRFLKASDLDGQEFRLEIASLTFEEFDRDDGGKEARPCLWFTKTDKGLVLNKTNASMIAHLHGNETDNWIGKIIAVGTESVAFKGQIVPALRVRGYTPSANGTPGQQPEPAAVADDLPAEVDDNSDLPF